METLRLDEPDAVLRFMDLPGKEPPLVFIHGLGCAGSSHFPRMLAERAVAAHRRVVIDLFGHGFSDRPRDFGYTLEEHAAIVARLLDHLSLESCGVFGHSMGGSIAITLAAQRPDLVSQLILAEANLNSGGGFISKVIAGQTEEEFVRTGHQALLERLTAGGFVTSVGSFRVCDPHGLYLSAVGLVKGTAPIMRERLYAMRIPRAYLMGERGLPDPETDELPRHGIRVPIIANAGHDMMFDNPSGVAETIKQELALQRV